MREIICRAWLKNSHEMVDVETMNFYTEEIIDRNGFTHKCEDYELMQFTGLIDKNTEMIYEGDIVSYSNAIANYQVMWGNCGFVIKDKYGLLITPTQKAVDYLKVEVIGNIYDNPELIKGDNEDERRN